MKKLFAFITALLVLSFVAFADVTVKDLGNGSVEVTFFYGNPKATAVVVAGDFTNWQTGALPMTKVAKGWEYKTTVPTATIMKYKFISDGNWTADVHAPDSIDDGFGGKNGLVDVAAMVAASKSSADASVATVKKANVKFQTWSMFGFQTKFNTTDKLEVASSGLNLQSYWKFSGEAVPGVPVYVELALAEQHGFNNLYNKGTLSLADGFKNLAVDTAFDPLYFYGGQTAAATYLGHFKAGITTDQVEWTTGYKYAKLTPHTNVSWTTVDKEWEAGYLSTGGFNIISLGSAYQQIGDVTINATIAPNRSADRAGSQYGMYAFANATYAGNYLDFQYNGAYGYTFDTIFNNIYEADYILGYSGKAGPVSIKANALYNQWGAKLAGAYKIPYTPATSDVANAVDNADTIDNVAANVQAIYNTDLYGVTLGYRARGSQASMMYVEQGADDHFHLYDQLGYVNTQRVWLDAYAKPVTFLTLGLSPYVDMVLNKAGYDTLSTDRKPYNDKNNINIYVKPSFDFAMKDFVGLDSTLSAYGKFEYNTSSLDKFTRGTTVTQYVIPEAGLKLAMVNVSDVIKGVDVYYGYDNNVDYNKNDTGEVFHTLIGDAQLPADLILQAGFGVRVANAGTVATKSPFGMFIGASKKLTVLQKPVLYTQFLYNMDPYKGFVDGQDSFNLNGSVLAAGFADAPGGVKNYEGSAAVRLALRWDL